MEGWQTRLLKERRELKTRVGKLTSFITAESFDGIHTDDQNSLMQQLAVMNSLLTTLTARIGRWLDGAAAIANSDAYVQLRFEGCSDDTFGEYAHFQDDYDCCANGSAIAWRLWSPGEGVGLHVVGQYAGREWPGSMAAVWLIGFQPLDEDLALPDWSFQFEQSDRPYSQSLLMEAPADVELMCLNRRGDDEADEADEGLTASFG